MLSHKGQLLVWTNEKANLTNRVENKAHVTTQDRELVHTSADDNLHLCVTGLFYVPLNGIRLIWLINSWQLQLGLLLLYQDLSWWPTSTHTPWQQSCWLISLQDPNFRNCYHHNHVNNLLWALPWTDRPTSLGHKIWEYLWAYVTPGHAHQGQFSSLLCHIKKWHQTHIRLAPARSQQLNVPQWLRAVTCSSEVRLAAQLHQKAIQDCSVVWTKAQSVEILGRFTVKAWNPCQGPDSKLLLHGLAAMAPWPWASSSEISAGSIEERPVSSSPGSCF